MGSHVRVLDGAVSPASFGPEIRLAGAIAKSLGTPQSLKLLGLLRKRDWSGIAGLSIDPLSYADAEAFRRDYLATQLLSKYQVPVGGSNPDVKCFEKMIRNEARCESVNQLLAGGFASRYMPANAIMYIASRKIADLLLIDGPIWPEVFKYVKPTSGASTRCSRRNGDIYYKVQGKPDVTPNCWLRAVQLVCSIPAWRRAMVEVNSPNPNDWFTIVEGNHVTTVPKKSDESRTIALEPEMNMLLQRAYGRFIKYRLRRAGIDLRTQQRNQRAARRGARWGYYATVDFSSASDLNSYMYAQTLMPVGHFEVLDCTRSPKGAILDPNLQPVKWFEWQKIASMGNGWCFELETLLFWALAEATCQYLDGKHRRCLVYGDDVIIPAHAAPGYLALMSLLGHTPNKEKTFTHGPFRESCGKHYFSVTDVSPFYIRKPAVDIPGERSQEEELYKIGNRIRSWCETTPGYAEATLYNAWSLCVSLVDNPCLVPLGYGDVGFAATFIEALPVVSRRKGSHHARDLQHLSFQTLDASQGRTFKPEGYPGYLRWMLYMGVAETVEAPPLQSLSDKFGRSFAGMKHLWRTKSGGVQPLYQSETNNPEWSSDLRVLPRFVRWKRRKWGGHVAQWVDAPLWCVD